MQFANVCKQFYIIHLKTCMVAHFVPLKQFLTAASYLSTNKCQYHVTQIRFQQYIKNSMNDKLVKNCTCSIFSEKIYYVKL